MPDESTEPAFYHTAVLPNFATHLHVCLCRLCSPVCTLAWEPAQALWWGECCTVQLGLR